MMSQELNSEDLILSYKVGVCLLFYCHSEHSGNLPTVTQLVINQGQNVNALLPDTSPRPFCATISLLRYSTSQVMAVCTPVFPALPYVSICHMFLLYPHSSWVNDKWKDGEPSHTKLYRLDYRLRIKCRCSSNRTHFFSFCNQMFPETGHGQEVRLKSKTDKAPRISVAIVLNYL